MKKTFKVIDIDKIDVIFKPKFGKVYNIVWNNVVIGELEFDGDKIYYVFFKSDFIKEMNNSIPFITQFQASLSMSIGKQIKNFVVKRYNNSLYNENNLIKVDVMTSNYNMGHFEVELNHKNITIYDQNKVNSDDCFCKGFDTWDEFYQVIKTLLHNDHLQCLQKSSIASRDYVLVIKG